MSGSNASSINDLLNSPDPGEPDVATDDATSSPTTTTEPSGPAPLTEDANLASATEADDIEGAADERPRDERGRFVSPKLRVGDEEYDADRVQQLRSEHEQAMAWQALNEQRQRQFAAEQQRLQQERRQLEEQRRQVEQSQSSETALLDYFRWRDQQRSMGRDVDVEDYLQAQQGQQAQPQGLSEERIAQLMDERLSAHMRSIQQQSEHRRRAEVEGNIDAWGIDAVSAQPAYAKMNDGQKAQVATRVGIALRAKLAQNNLPPDAIFSLPPQQIQQLIRGTAAEVARQDREMWAAMTDSTIQQHDAATRGLKAPTASGGTPALTQPEVMRSEMDTSRMTRMEDLFTANKKLLDAELAEIERRSRSRGI